MVGTEACSITGMMAVTPEPPVVPVMANTLSTSISLRTDDTEREGT